MKRYYLLLLPMLGLSSLVYSTPSSAEVYLSRDLCRVDYASLYQHAGQQKVIMSRAERYDALKVIFSVSGEPCLEPLLYRFSSDYKKSTERRTKPYLDNCSGLPKKFYADKDGKVIYKLTDKQMSLLENRMLDDNVLAACISPFLKW